MYLDVAWYRLLAQMVQLQAINTISSGPYEINVIQLFNTRPVTCLTCGMEILITENSGLWYAVGGISANPTKTEFIRNISWFSLLVKWLAWNRLEESCNKVRGLIFLFGWLSFADWEVSKSCLFRCNCYHNQIERDREVELTVAVRRKDERML